MEPLEEETHRSKGLGDRKGVVSGERRFSFSHPFTLSLAGERTATWSSRIPQEATARPPWSVMRRRYENV